MPNAREIHEGLGILLKYATKESDYMAAEHDKVWLPGPEPSKLTEQERVRLEKLRVCWDEDTESWWAFT